MNDWSSRRHIHVLLLMAATAFGIYLCYRMFLPFLPALAWALALAILFMPVHRRLELRIKHRNVAAWISVLVLILIVLVPLAFVGHRLVLEAAKGAELIGREVESGTWRRVLEANPRVVPVVHWIEGQIDVPAAVNDAATWLTGATGSFLKGSVMGALGLCLTFYLLFYFLRDRQAALGVLCQLSPLSKPEMEKLFSHVVDTIYATIYGTLTVAIVQGTLGGLMFWWLGLPAPLFWGVVMGLLAVVPVLGAFVVWIPASVFLLLAGSWEKALILTVWGWLVVGGIDNLLYPMLVGNRLKIHTVLAFISIVGGLIVFGPSGLILGPLALTITIVLLEIWQQRNGAPDLPAKEASETAAVDDPSTS